MVKATYIRSFLLGMAFIAFSNSLHADPPGKLLNVEATRYEISFINSYQHSLRVALKDRATRKVEHFVLHPGEVKTFKGQFNKERLQDLEVFCTYDFETFRADINRFRSKLVASNSKKRTEIEGADWYKFVDRFLDLKNVKTYLKDFDFEQLTIDEKSAENLAFDISEKVARDQALFANLENENFGGHSPTTAKAAVAAVLELAHHAADYDYVDRVKYLKSTMELLSSKNFIQQNRDLVYNMADGLDLRRVAPDYLVSFTPIIFTQSLNESWRAPNEVGLDTDKILSEGWFNNTLSLHVGRAITDERRFGSKMLHARLYGSLFLEKISYTLSERGLYSAGEDYVNVRESASGTTFDVTNDIDNIKLEMTHLGGSLIGKLMVSDWMFFDIEGGVMTKQGRLDFRNGAGHFEDNVNVLDYTHSNSMKVLQRSFAPFIKVKNGVGYSPRKGTGFYFTSSFIAFQSFLEPNDNYQIYDRISSPETLLPTTSNSWLYSVTFGVDYLF